MVRYAKKNQYDGMENMKLHRFQRRYRGHKLAVAIGVNKRDRAVRHRGWWYVKRRALIEEEV